MNESSDSDTDNEDHTKLHKVLSGEKFGTVETSSFSSFNDGSESDGARSIREVENHSEIPRSFNESSFPTHGHQESMVGLIYILFSSVYHELDSIGSWLAWL